MSPLAQFQQVHYCHIEPPESRVAFCLSGNGNGTVLLRDGKEVPLHLKKVSHMIYPCNSMIRLARVDCYKEMSISVCVSYIYI